MVVAFELNYREKDDFDGCLNENDLSDGVAQMIGCFAETNPSE